MAESDPLITNGRNYAQDDESQLAREQSRRSGWVRAIVHGLLTIAFIVGVIVFLVVEPGKVKDPGVAVDAILRSSPVIDGHIDLPILVRARYANNVSAVDLESRMPEHVDIPRLRQGRVGGFFWSVYVSCPENAGKDFTKATWRVRDTLEQIDVAKLLIDKYPETFQLAKTSLDIKFAVTKGKIASLLGVEGAHQLGNSLSVLRQYYDLGVRYVTLTHMCHNAFADSCGYLKASEPLHHGLSPIGKSLVREMNRLGMLVDLSHTSDATASQVLNLSLAPVIWSHSSARAVHDVARNVPDSVLEKLGKDGVDGVVMVNFAPQFVADDGKATVEVVADHVEHIAKVAGKEHVGIGSDFDGIDSVPKGLEDVSDYPALFAELYTRGWTAIELSGLSGGNLLRVMDIAERVSAEMKKEGVEPAMDLYDKRDDLPMKRREL
ncbi:hypothetical protein JAAARDRAFT_39293 [Jaapia argillacea MUCL 33604]|uniref:Dipeptidase n=1 Tax=Jaapia argillacea MUCL 33604 TaxID=933084 RepID=A0A067PTD1_9AGAM|nr:hypothetical protein JAAARDRAFT_39293 [Jaapia argillacea MUCL 33604]